METIPAFEAKTHFSALLDRAEKGEHLVITWHGYPVADIVPHAHISAAKESLAEQFRAVRKGCRLGGLN